MSWQRKSVVSRSGQGSRGVPGASTFHRARRNLARSDRTPDVVLPNGQSVGQTSMRCRFQLLDRSKWKLSAYGGFFRKENIIDLEARSILHAVQHAEGRCPPGRLLILSDNLALVLALCKGRSNFLCIAFSHAVGSFASSVQGRFYPVV